MRIVITSIGSFGDVFPYIGLARGLEARGHELTLAMPGYYRETVEKEGIRFVSTRPDINPNDLETIGRIMNPRTGSEYLVRWLFGPPLRESFDDLLAATRGADLMITHPITYAAPVVAEHLGIRWASTVLAPLSFFSAYEFPVLPPAPWLKKIERIPGAARLFVKLAKTMTLKWTKPLADLRRELGLPSRGNPIFEGQHSPHLVLAMYSRVLGGPQPDWPRNVVITGAVTYNGHDSLARTLSPPLEAFLAEGEPPIVFTLGSSAVGAAGRFYEESAAALRRMGKRGVLLIGPHERNRPAGPLPPNIHLEPFAPHSALFPRAAAVVHQGGAGTMHHALGAGVPTLIVPHGHDQPDNAYRVALLGVSRSLTPRSYKAARVVRELETLLSDGDYRNRAAVVARQVRAEDAVRTACDAIESLR
jgi:rhamnosyltransferase subunit B